MTTFSYSTDKINWYGNYNKMDAIKNGFDNNPDFDFIFIGENINFTAHDFVSARHFFEHLRDEAMEECGENVEEWLDKLIDNKNKCAELEMVIGNWIETNAPVNFRVVNYVLEIQRQSN